MKAIGVILTFAIATCALAANANMFKRNSFTNECETTIAITNICGHSFGEPCVIKKKCYSLHELEKSLGVKANLKKQFRYFDSIRLFPSKLESRLEAVKFETEFKNATDEDVIKEAVSCMDVIAKKYGFKNTLKPYHLQPDYAFGFYEKEVGKYVFNVAAQGKSLSIKITDTSIAKEEEERLSSKGPSIADPKEDGSDAL